MQNKDIYDTIIENLTKEWYSSMSENILNNNPNWEVPKYQKSKLIKLVKLSQLCLPKLILKYQ